MEEINIVRGAEVLLGAVTTITFGGLLCFYLWALKNFVKQTALALAVVVALVCGCFTMPIIAKGVVALGTIGGLAAMTYAVKGMFVRVPATETH